MSARSAASGMPGKASAIGESAIIALGSAIQLSRFSSEAFRAELLHAGGIRGVIGDARRFPSDNAVEFRSDRFCASGPIW